MKWTLPAGALNVLWGSLFPRLVAKQWLHDLKPAGHPKPVVWPGMGKADLLDSLSRLSRRRSPQGSALASTGAARIYHEVWNKQVAVQFGVPQGLALPQLPGRSQAFLDRVGLVRSVLKAKSAPPVSVLRGGGFDFVLSEDGIEFFIPDPPKDVHDLLRYYSFRATGRPSIGLPLYLPGPFSAVVTDAPTGPGQVSVTPSKVTVRTIVEGLTGSGSPLPAACDSCVEALKVGSLAGIDQYLGVMSIARRWQVQGSVYRGIMTELPRVVAVAWMEQFAGTTNAPGAYWPRVFDTNIRDRDDGLRGLFRERLETHLPNGTAMAFDVGRAAPAAVAWDPADVMISNLGFHFPEPMDLTASPDPLGDLLREIAEGRAGNPVFTDSKRPEREG